VNQREPFKANELSEISQSDVASLRASHADYGDSWKKRGGVGAFMMLARKWDRIEKAMMEKYGYDIIRGLMLDTRAEGLIDDIRDLRRYLMLVESEVHGQHEEVKKQRTNYLETQVWREGAADEIETLYADNLEIDAKEGMVVMLLVRGEGKPEIRIEISPDDSELLEVSIRNAIVTAREQEAAREGTAVETPPPPKTPKHLPTDKGSQCLVCKKPIDAEGNCAC
jgi:hypothetical protein